MALHAEVEAQVTQIAWAGPVTWRHLALLRENEKLMSVITNKLEELGYTDCSFAGISAVTESIEDLVIALETDATKDGARARHTIHVKMNGLEISFH